MKNKGMRFLSKTNGGLETFQQLEKDKLNATFKNLEILPKGGEKLVKQQ